MGGGIRGYKTQSRLLHLATSGSTFLDNFRTVSREFFRLRLLLLRSIWLLDLTKRSP